MRYECGSLPAVVIHNGMNLYRKFARIEILPVSSRANYVVGAHTRPERADCLIDFDLSNNRSTVACGQCQRGKVLITRSRFSNSRPKNAISKSQSHDTLCRASISTYTVTTAHSPSHQCYHLCHSRSNPGRVHPLQRHRRKDSSRTYAHETKGFAKRP